MEKIIEEQLKKTLPFDLYGRYATIRNIINNNRRRGEQFSVLDVGGRGNMLQKFLPNDNVFYLEPLINSDDENFIKGDACAMNLSDESFDWVTSADVFEHITKEKREVFLSENIRVAKMGIVLAAPFYSEEVVQAEINANENYKILSGGVDHMWLKEHIENGLPDTADIERFLEDRKIVFQKLHNNRLFLWQTLINASFLVFENFQDDIKKEFENFNYFYNTEIFPFDNQGPSYRKLYFIKKDSSLKNIETGSKTIDDELFLRTIKNSFNLTNKINEINKNIIRQKNIELSTIEKIIQQKSEETHLNNINLKQKEQEIKFIKSSKFWKVRNVYIKYKSKIFYLVLSPEKFVKKYLKI